MELKTDRLYPSAPLEKIDLEQRLEKKINDVSSCNNHINNIKEKITYFKDKNSRTKKKCKKYKTITTILKSFVTFVIIGATASSITLSLTGISLIAISISTATACGLSIGNKVIFETTKDKCNKYKKLYEIDQQTIISFDKLCRKSLQDNIFDKIEYESLCNILTKYVDKTKLKLFYKHEYK